MKDGKCPKCNSTNVFKRDSGFTYGEGTLYVVDSASGAKPQTVHPATFDSYACINCGYYENYITDTYELGLIQKNWVKVS